MELRNRTTEEEVGGFFIKLFEGIGLIVILVVAGFVLNLLF